MRSVLERIIRVDLGTGQVQPQRINENLFRSFLGGAGLAAKIFSDEVSRDVDPLAPENPLIIMTGPLTGTRFPGSGRFSVASRSPLTGLWGEASCGGAFGPALKLSGYDGIVIQGKSQTPVYLLIEGEEVTIRDASPVWGMDTYEANRWFGENVNGSGGPVRAIQIGAAGENMVLFANIVNELGSVAGRCGLGAVMGSKQLKAIVIRGSGGMPWGDSERTKAVRKDITGKLKQSVLAQTLHELGTNGALDTGMLTGDVPVRNWSIGEWDEALETLNSFYYNDHLLIRATGCHACPVRCKRVVEVKDGPYRMEKGPGPEYETICIMGTNLMNASLEAVAKANDLCNRLGLDTIAMGAVIALLMEAQEKDLIREGDTGLDFSWGNMETAHKAIELTAFMKHFGVEMAKGSRRLAEHLGAPELAVNVRGLDLPAHDPRGYHGYALAYTMGTRGACHLNSVNMLVEGGMASWPEIGLKGPFRGTTSEGKAELTWKCMAIGQVFNSLCMCEFIGAFLGLHDQVDMLEAATDEPWSLDELLDCGWRIWYLKRLLLNRYGSGRRDDVLPAHILTPTQEGANANSVPDMETMLREFYDIAQLDEEGRPLPEALERYGLIKE